MTKNARRKKAKAPSCTCLYQTGAGGAFAFSGCFFGSVEVSEVSVEVPEVD